MEIERIHISFANLGRVAGQCHKRGIELNIKAIKYSLSSKIPSMDVMYIVNTLTLQDVVVKNIEALWRNFDPSS